MSALPTVPEPTERLQVVGGPPALRPAARQITEAVQRRAPVTDAGALELAVHELLANALEHGHLGDPSLPIDVEVAAGDGGTVTVRVTDRAVTGPWSPQRSPGAQGHGRERTAAGTRGRGLALVAAATAELRIVATAGCTVVEVQLPVFRARGGPAG